MKIRLSLVLLNILFLTGCFVNEQVTSNENIKGDQSGKADEAKLEENMNQLVITINQETFKITLYENETTAALLEQLPLSLSMEDLHRNEKYVALDESLPTQSERVQSISTGDFMLYGSNTLVLFYEDFSTTYSYTRLGYVENPEQLRRVVGSGAVIVEIDSES